MPLPPVSVALAKELGEPVKPDLSAEPAVTGPEARKDASAIVTEAPQGAGEASGKDSADAADSADASDAPRASDAPLDSDAPRAPDADAPDASDAKPGQADTEEAPAEADAEEADQADQADQAEEAEADAEGKEEAEGTEGSGKRKRKAGLRARVLAELKSASPWDMKARLESQLAEHDVLIAAAMDVEAGKQKLVDEALAEVDRLSQVVKEASELEEQALGRAKDLRKRKREAAKECTERQKEVQHQEDLLVLLGFEVERLRKHKEAEASMESEKDAKRQKIQELLQVAEEAKKAQDEMRLREKEARQAVRQLEKEQKQLQLGPFGRRQNAARKARATKSSEAVQETPGESSNSAPVVDLLPVKREGALHPFPTRPAETAENLVISIEDSQ